MIFDNMLPIKRDAIFEIRIKMLPQMGQTYYECLFAVRGTTGSIDVNVLENFENIVKQSAKGGSNMKIFFQMLILHGYLYFDS